jgi:hypothetical protein
MKILNQKILFVFIVSLAFCSEDEKYTFQYTFDYPEDSTEYIEKWQHETEWSFDVPGIGYVKYASTHITLSQYLGKDGEFYKFKSTVIDMESNNSVDNIKLKDYYREAMEGKPCYIYVKIDGNGLIDYIEPVDPEHAYLQEAYEDAYMGLAPRNYRYPLGRLAQNISLGGSWISSDDSLKFYVGIGSPQSRWWSRAVWNLKKVKDKRGIKTAHIDGIDEITTDLNMMVDIFGEMRLITGNASGKRNVKLRWDVENTGIIFARTRVQLQGDFEMDDETFSSKFYFNLFTKRVQ